MARLSDIPNDSLLFFSFSKKFVFTVCPCVPNDILTNWRMKLDTNLMPLEAFVVSHRHYYHGGRAKFCSGDFVGTECGAETLCQESYTKVCKFCRGTSVYCIKIIWLAQCCVFFGFQYYDTK